MRGRQHWRLHPRSCLGPVDPRSLLLLAIGMVQVSVVCSGAYNDGRMGNEVWIEMLSPLNRSVLYFGDETTKIGYRTADLPAGAQVLLTINGKEALRNPATEINVDVPGLVVGHHEIAVTVLDVHAAPLASQHLQFEMRAGYSWVDKHVVVADDTAASSCSKTHTQDACSFLIDARGDGSSPDAGHFFRVRLIGPAIVMGTIQELNATPGVYKVEYTAVDSGVYTMSVVLVHASNTGVADPGQGIPRQFINQHIRGSPFLVRVGDEAQEGEAVSNLTHKGRHTRAFAKGQYGIAQYGIPQYGIAQYAIPQHAKGSQDGKGGHYEVAVPWPLCQGLRRHGRRGKDGTGAGPPWIRGRWVHKHVCLWFSDACEGVDSQAHDQADAPEFQADPWVWVPYGASFVGALRSLQKLCK